MAVVGAMLIEKEAVLTAQEILDESDFYDLPARAAFSSAAALAARDRPVDLLTVAEELRKGGRLDAAGGAEFLAKCVDRVATAAHVEHYARIVREKAELRRLIGALTSSLTDCYCEKASEVLSEEAQARISAAVAARGGKSFADAKALMRGALDDIERLHRDKRRVTGVTTGFRALDEMTSGFHKGDLILIAARPSQGKTALALSIAMNAALSEQAVGVAFMSMEMRKSEIGSRLIAAEARMSLQDVRRGYFQHSKWAGLTSAAARIADARFYIDDSPNLTVQEIRRRVRTLAREAAHGGRPLGLVVIDYIQIMKGSSSRVENRQLEVSEMSRGLKALARDLDLPVVALSQLSRRAEEKTRVDGRPQLSDLRDSGALEQDADLVMLIYREAAAKPNDPSVDQAKAEVIIAKQRQGPTGSVFLRFSRELARFEDPAPDDGGPWQDGQEAFA